MDLDTAELVGLVQSVLDRKDDRAARLGELIASGVTAEKLTAFFAGENELRTSHQTA
jgi:hypothetical protein